MDDRNVSSPFIAAGKVPAFFEQVGRKILYKKKETIVYADDRLDDIYIIIKGKAKKYVMSEEGREKILFILTPGCIMGGFSSPEAEKAGYFVEALENLELVYLTPFDLKEALRKYPEFSLYILSSINKQAKCLIDQVKDICFKDAETRVCNILIQLAFYQGKMDKNSQRIQFKTNQQLISDLAGINRITAVKIIKSLKEMGLLDVRGTRYTINDLSLLQMYAIKDC